MAGDGEKAPTFAESEILDDFDWILESVPNAVYPSSLDLLRSRQCSNLTCIPLDNSHMNLVEQFYASN